MTSRCFTVAFQGIDAIPIDVQVQIAPGLPAFNIVGLGDKAVNESRERIRSAFHSYNLALPAQRVTVNLSPADLPKEGSHYDLPIALGILSALEVIDTEVLYDFFVLGELGLDGSIKSIPGVLPTSIAAYQEGKGIICPQSSLNEARWSGTQNILAATTLLELMSILKNGIPLKKPLTPLIFESTVPQHYGDFSDVKGQIAVKRAAEIAAAGGHNLLMSGPPGSGKSMIASRMISILPALTPEEALEVTMIHSISGHVPENGIMTWPPFRSPHHSATLPALIGGGSRSKPGEVSLAHHGVLFLDELPEFQRSTLEALRQPLENGSVTISRANSIVHYPSRCMVIAAMNPCKCGYLGQRSKECSRAPLCGEHYKQRLSGPLLDRFDLNVFVKELDSDVLFEKTTEESSADIKKRVEKARSIQYQRAKNQKPKEHGKFFYEKAYLNAAIPSDQLSAITPLSDESEMLLKKAVNKLMLSTRGFYRTLRIARTIADLENAKDILPHHISEAITYRI